MGTGYRNEIDKEKLLGAGTRLPHEARQRRREQRQVVMCVSQPLPSPAEVPGYGSVGRLRRRTSRRGDMTCWSVVGKYQRAA